MDDLSTPAEIADRDPWSVFLVFLRLGLTSFGGPIAHLGYFRDEFVVRRQWLSERGYADLVALCQFLPGPSSSQVGIALGLTRAGYGGALAAWLGFTLPSAIVLILFASLLLHQGNLAPGALQGLKIAAVAVVAQAIWGMARSLCPDRQRVTIMAFAAIAVLLLASIWSPLLVLVAAGLVGLVLLKPAAVLEQDTLSVSVSRRAGVLALGVFFALLIGLPLLVALMPTQLLTLVDSFYRVGSLVFGGGHVVLPLLQAETVDTGLPGWLNGLLCLGVVFLQSFLLVIGILPFWDQLRHNLRMQAALAGVNAAVVGLLLAALYQPMWTTAIGGAEDFALALAALVALVFWKLPPWLVVVATAGIGWTLLG